MLCMDGGAAMPQEFPTTPRLDRRSVLAAAAAALATTPLSAMSAPKSELWARWQTRDDASATRVDHAAWDNFLKRHLRESPDGINRLVYGRVPQADKTALDAYVAALEAIAVGKLARPEQRAF
jgi:hypothetical protein